MGNFSILRLICWPIYPAIHPYTPLKKKWKTSNFRKTKKEKKKQIKIMISLSRVYLHNILCCLLHGILESLGCFIASFHRTWDVRDSFSLRFLDKVHGILLTLRSPSWMQLWKGEIKACRVYITRGICSVYFQFWSRVLDTSTIYQIFAEKVAMNKFTQNAILVKRFTEV